MDHRKKELPLIYIAAGFGLGLLLRLLPGAGPFLEILSGFLPGLICLALAKGTKEAIGYGDALMIIALGAFCNVAMILLLLFCGFLLAGLFCLVLLILKKRNKKEAIPFIPFLLGGYVILLAII